MAKKMIKHTPIKESNRYVVFLAVFLLTLLVFYLVIPRIIPGSINFWFNISELDGEVGQFSISYRLILEIIFMGPIFAIVYFFLMKYLIEGIDEERGKNKYYIKLLEIGVITFICISCMGHIVHMMFDRASWMYILANNDSMDTSELYSYIYYSDEWLGHHLIHIGLYGYTLMALFAEFLGKEEERRKLNGDELTYTILLGAATGIIAYTTYEGQAAFMMLILWTILLSVELFVIIIKKINILERPILLYTLINSIIFIILFIIWVSIFGVKPYYPFIYQPSELR